MNQLRHQALRALPGDVSLTCVSHSAHRRRPRSGSLRFPLHSAVPRAPDSAVWPVRGHEGLKIGRSRFHRGRPATRPGGLETASTSLAFSSPPLSIQQGWGRVLTCPPVSREGVNPWIEEHLGGDQQPLDALPWVREQVSRETGLRAMPRPRWEAPGRFGEGEGFGGARKRVERYGRGRDFERP